MFGNSIAEIGENVYYYVADVTETEKAKELIDQIVADYGSIDILVNNAGRHCKKEVADITIQDFRDVMDIMTRLRNQWGLTYPEEELD